MANKILSLEFLIGYLGWMGAGLIFASPYLVFKNLTTSKSVLEEILMPDVWSGNFLDMLIENTTVWILGLITAFIIYIFI